MPVGSVAMDRACRAPVIAAVRAGLLTGAEAQTILGTSRSYISQLANHTDEGKGVEPLDLELRSETLLARAAIVISDALDRAFGTLLLSERAGDE